MLNLNLSLIYSQCTLRLVDDDIESSYEIVPVLFVFSL